MNSFMIAGFWIMSVSTFVGQTALTRMYCGPSSSARVFISPDDAVLGRRVVPQVGYCAEAHRRAGEEDRAALPRRHDGGMATCAVSNVPVRMTSMQSCHFCGVRSSTWLVDARVGAHDVEPAELVDARGDRRGEAVVVPDVDLAGDDPPVELLDLGGGLGEVLLGAERVVGRRDRLADVEGDDVRALLRQPDRVGPALAARGPHDQGDLVLDASHPGPRQASRLVST
jgi:hypothetical protein